MKLTKKLLADRWRIHNPWNLCEATKTNVYIGYITQDLGRAGHNAKWQVIRPGFQTDPTAHWTDNGHKTFDVWHQADRESQLKAALAWASEKYGIPEWERSPFGSYHPKGTMARLTSQAAIDKAEGKG